VVATPEGGKGNLEGKKWRKSMTTKSINPIINCKGEAEMSDLVEYKPGTPFPGVIGRTLDESSPAWPEPTRARESAPNIIFFVLDDVGYGQLSPFGGLVNTPNLDKLAQRGLRYTNFHTTALPQRIYGL
jgi:hypothetical protein